MITIKATDTVIARMEKVTNEDWTVEEKKEYILTGVEPFDYLGMFDDDEMEAIDGVLNFEDVVNLYFDTVKEKTLKKINELESKVYKKTKLTCIVGSHCDFESRTVSVQAINIGRNAKKIRGEKEFIKELEMFRFDFLKKDTEFFTGKIPHFFSGEAVTAFDEIAAQLKIQNRK
jgi:hypothetical protein